MKKIKFNKVTQCESCKQKFVGYRGKRCPICSANDSVAIRDEQIVTLVKKGKIK